MEIELYKKYHSLRKVSKLTGIPISTLWYRLSKKGIINKKNIVNALNENDELLKGLYTGLWAGDGSRYYDGGFISKIHLNKKDKKLIEFIIIIIKRLFQKKVKLYLDGKNDNRASIKIHSKFIYDFPEKYLAFSRKKSKSVRLKIKPSSLFLDGFFLGLTLSDGYLKERFIFTTISEHLSNQMIELLSNKGFSPKKYVQNRKKFGWNDLHFIRLRKKESLELKQYLDKIIRSLGMNYSIDSLKRYKE